MSAFVEQDVFKAFLLDLKKTLPVSCLDKFKTKAWDRYETLGLPDKSEEAFRTVKLRALYAAPLAASLKECALPSFEKEILPECKESYLVFVNGQLELSLSCREGISENVILLPIEEAFQTYGALLNNQWNASLKKETDAFALLNGALHQKGLFVYLPPGCAVEKPIQFIFLTTKSSSMPRVQVFAGKNSEAHFYVSEISPLEDHIFINEVFDFCLEEAANLKFCQLSLVPKPTFWHMAALRALLKRDARLEAVFATMGSATVRADYRVALVGENAEALLKGVSFLKEKQEAHVHIFMDHEAPHCRSHQHFKSILSDFSRAGFEGKIMVRQAAQKTDAFQMNNNLLLSSHAKTDSKPNLEIFADDVKASHGATVGQLDEEQLLYLRTRGLKVEEARELLLEGFTEEILKAFPPSFQEQAKRAFYG